MASSEEGSKSPAEKKRSAGISRLNSRFSNTWLGRNWQTALIIVLIVFLAFFVRTYFGYSTSVDNGFLVSGGSDSYYHERVIDNVANTGQHVVQDNMLNYPWGIRNERPPLYDWSVAVAGMFLHTVTGMTLTDGLGFALVFSTAIWGALTTIPVYLLTKAAFGKKPAILAALLFALMAGNIERSIFSDADHDAMVLFFVVFAFYFLLRALQTIKGDRWVSKWSSFSEVKKGLRSFGSLNGVSMLYAALAGVCVALVAMIWTGYTYVLIIILAYLIVQLLVDRFRNADSLGVVASIGIMFAVAFLVMAPLYIQMNYVQTWLDTPVEMFLVAVIAGMIFVVTRDYPWTITLPVIAAISVIALIAFYIVSPNFFNAIVSGQGYLVKSKLYSTISEATAPAFSTLALSFGAVTFWLALFGVGYAAVRIPKNLTPYLVFLVVWTGVSIYMAASAGRFVFNATPAFAVMAGWILMLIIERAQFSEFYKSMAGSRGSLLRNLRKSIKFRHVFVFLVVLGLVILPNAWTALDAGIPNQTKKTYDKQIYLATPDFLKPSKYDLNNGTWYLGAFSYDLPLPTTYYPAAWSWLNERDSGIANPLERPAYISWWDYGFEAVQAGGHPTVADNFQNGYQVAGSFLMCSNETGAIALMVTRIIEKVGLSNSTDMSRSAIDLLLTYGVNYNEMYHILYRPSDYVNVVKNNPAIYGPYDTDLSVLNAYYAAARVELSKIGENKLVSLYHDLRGLTGYNIGYFAVDSRLFPFSATSQNIFYAPAKLSDQRIDPLSNAPLDYYTITAVDQYGTEHALADVTSSMTIVSYAIHYTPLFYKTMLYRAFMGYGPYDIGLTSQGIPGISGSLSYYQPMQGWNMTHFRMVYRTAYFNPYTDYSNHTDSWVAINYTQGQEYRALISAGKMNGTVDLSAGGLFSAVVFLQYYDGVTISGTVLSEQTKEPMPNVYVTALDDNRDPTYYPYGIPHQTVKTDANGNYSIIAPFGNTTIAYSYGTLDNVTQLATIISTKSYPISYAEAMGATGAGGNQKVINGDINLTAASLSGKAYWDRDGDSVFDVGTDILITGATVVLQNKTTGYFKSQVSTATGYSFLGLPPATVNMYAIYQGHIIGSVSVDLNPKNGNITKDLAIKPAQVKGVIMLPSGDVAQNVQLQLRDLTTGRLINTTTSSAGQFTYDLLFSGNYSLSSASSLMSLGSQTYSLTAGETLNKALTIYSAMTVSGHASNNGNAIPFAQIEIMNGKRQIWTEANANGDYSITVPLDNYTVYSFATVKGVQLVALANVTGLAGSVTQNMVLAEATATNLQVVSATLNGVQFVIKSKSSPAAVYAVSNQTGGAKVLLPSGVYSIYVYAGSTSVYWADLTLPGTGVQNITMVNAVTLSGKVWFDSNFDGSMGSSEGIGNATITVTNQAGEQVTFYTDSTGAYIVPLVINGTYTMTESLINYVTYSVTYADFNTSTVNNIKLVPTNRTVSLTTTFNGGAPLKPLTVTLTAVGKGAITVKGVTSAAGDLTLSVRPGQYNITISENVTTDSNDQYQLQAGNVPLTIRIGQNATALSLPVVERVLVTGVSAGGATTLTFTGKDVRTQSFAAGAAYSIYLMSGVYGVYADVSSTAGHLALFNTTTVTGPGAYDVIASPASLVQVQVQNGGKQLNASASLSFSSPNGATYNATTNATGYLGVYMPSSQLTVRVDVHTLGTLNGLSRYLRYTGAATINVGTVTFPLNLDTVRSFDNSTVTGTMIGVGATAASGTISFAPDSPTAIWANYTTASGSINVQLAPGTYSAYANGGTSGTFLGKVTVTSYLNQTMNIQLVPGFTIHGTTSVGALPVQSVLTFSSVGNMTASSAPDGTYSVLLPAGSYDVKATTTLVEQGSNIPYTKTVTQTLTADTLLNIVLERASTRSVKVYWDPSQKATLSANQTAVYNISVTNTGDLADTYSLAASLAGWNITLSKNSVTLDFGATGVTTVQMTITPSKTVKVTQNSITFTATSANDSSVVATTLANVTIVPRFEVNATQAQVYANNGTNYRYQIKINNNGNIDDTYFVSVVNRDALRAQGWDVSLKSTGNYVDQVNVTVTSQSFKYIEFSMLPNSTSVAPALNPTASILIQSAGNDSTSFNYVFSPELPKVNIPSSGLAVTGDKTSSTQATLTLETTILLALVMVLFVLLIYLTVKKGVFTRRKR
ncbi:MAG TPA: STT3 domain-containing protein [Methanomassiliicoccales archaeon]|jgi:dolichyl-diphosphooligosaccharide--protein glycosyltransferase